MKPHLPLTLYRALMGALLLSTLSLTPQVTAATTFTGESATISGNYADGISAPNTLLTNTGTTTASSTNCPTIQAKSLHNSGEFTSTHPTRGSSTYFGEGNLHIKRELKNAAGATININTNVNSLESDSQYDIYGIKYQTFDNRADVNINMTASARGSIIGMEAYQYMYQGRAEESPLTNTGTITMQLQAENSATGILGRTGCRIDNSGTISILAEATGTSYNNAYARGIILSGGNLNNNGTITIDALAAPGNLGVTSGFKVSTIVMTNAANATLQVKATHDHEVMGMEFSSVKLTNQGRIISEASGGNAVALALYSSATPHRQ